MNSYVILLITLYIYMSFWFIMSLEKNRNDIADIAWGLGFVMMAWLSYFVSGQTSIRSILVCVLVTIWGLRLAWYIHKRNHGKPEDYRYRKWREDWGRWFYLRSYFQVYILQGILLFMVVSPVILINESEEVSLVIFDFVGILVWIIGFVFETVGDAQLAAFRKNPVNKGKLIKSGLWKYSRHPNYFGEVTQWWGIWFFTFGVGQAGFGLIGPVTITLLILFVSGIPLLEKKYEGRRDWEEYKKKTSRFFPMPVR